MADPVGYRMEWKPGDYCFLNVADFERELYKEGAKMWALYSTPQAGCDPNVAVYFGSHWLQPKYVNGRDLTGFQPLYLGPELSGLPAAHLLAAMDSLLSPYRSNTVH